MRALIEDLSEAVKENATRDNVADWIANRLINLDARSAYDSNSTRYPRAPQRCLPAR